MVHDAAQARKLAPALLCAAALVGGCGGASAPEQPASASTASTAAASGNPTLGNARLVDCAAWRRGDATARRGTIRQIAAFAGGPVGAPGGHGATLKPDIAYRFFDGYCANSYATYFKLYKLYTRAAAFTPQR